VFYVVEDLVGGLPDGIRKFFGWETAAAQQAEYHRENREKAKRAKRAFDRFLKKVPQLRAEQAKLAEEEKQRAALEAKARQEELRLLKRQARTAVGLKRMKPTNFELAVASLYLKLGYEVYGTPTSSDRGIDLVAIKDKERIAVQCKRYKRTVPVSQVRDFYGSFVGTYSRGIFVTSSTFSKSTREWAEERQGLELVNGQHLAKLFVEHNPKIVRNVEKWKEHS
jgi:restriction endonuclease Mrr